MKLETCEVLENKQITADMWALKLLAPRIAAEAKPGQFLHIRVGDSLEPLLRRPISLYRIGRDTVDLLIRPVGRGSRILAQKAVGQTLDCLGPLGNGFTIHPASRNLLMIGGGCGIGPLVALADLAIAKDLSVTLLFGARSANAVYPPDLLPAEVEYAVTTDDGSVGHHGIVTDLLVDYLGWSDAIYACGPRPMFLSILDIMRRVNYRKSVQVSLEENMACGVGACFGCAVETRRGEMKSVCQDGPVFEMKELLWK
ncbi:MAG: dihydroorotate dehydrogenase electron transfer subunit [Chloroflexota bacterium]|jgi:dihydroorotate dehydrogenase electron transfer subunit